MSWTNITLGKKIFPTTIQAIYNNQVYIRQQLLDQGYSVPSLTSVSTAYSCPLQSIKASFNNVEINLDVLERSIDWDNEFYGGPCRWGYNLGEYRSKIDRWVNCLNAYKSVIEGAEQTLMLKERGESPVFDINNQLIYIEKE